MRTIAALAALATLTAAAAVAAPIPSARTAALAAGDWRKAAELGASAADVVRALEARHQLTGADPEQSVVTIGPDNTIDVVALQPLPPLGAAAGARTANLAGSGFAFTARRGAIVLYPAYAQPFDAVARRPATP